MSKKLKGELSILKPQNSRDREFVNITLVDSLSSTQCVDIEIDLEKFAQALFALHGCECEFEWRPALVGMQRENKTVQVRYKCKSMDRGERATAAAKAIAEFEVDGWVGCLSDALNHHRCSHDGDWIIASVHFVRHVPVGEST